MSALASSSAAHTEPAAVQMYANPPPLTALAARPVRMSIRFTIGPRSALQTAPKPAAIEYGVLVSRRIARVSPDVGEIRCRRACWRHDAHSAPLPGSRESAYCG